MSSAVLLIALYAVINLVAFAAYRWDKRKAKKDRWRTPEATLILLGLIGPWGAVAGMQVFRHKTRKPKFKLNYLFLVLHILIICYIVSGRI